MKKLLLSMVGLLMAVTPALAKDIDETFESFTDAKATWLPTAQTATDQTFTSTVTGLTWTVNNVMAAKSSGVIYMTFNKNGGYMSTTPGIACSKISVFVYQAGAKGELSIYADGDATAIGTAKTTSADIAAKENVFTFEIPEQYRNADTGFKIATSGNQTYIKYINFIEGESVDPSKDPAGLSFGDTKSFRVVKGEDFTAPALINPNNLPVTWTSSDEAVATVDAEGALSILAPGKTTIKAASEATDKYFAGSASYELTVVGKAATIADLVANFTEKGDEAYVACPAVVTYVNGRNCYVKAVDGNAAALIYQETEYELGDVIPAGWYATASPYSGLLEYTAEGLQPSTETKEVVYEKVAAVTEADINRVVVLTGVNFAEDTPARTAGKDSKAANFNGTLADGSTLVFRTNFPVESVKAGAYEVTGAVAFYIPKEGDGYLQFYPISYKLDENTGVAGIEAEAEAVYYDLQGNRVAEPETGVYIKVVGGRASKVLF